MQVIFLEDVLNVANAGDIKNVANGFARNYLLPKKLAAPATAEHIKRLKKIRQAADVRRRQETAQWETLAQQLEGTTLTLKARAGPTGEFYGAITVTQILEELKNVTGHTVERRMLEVTEPIRKPGSYQIALRLQTGVEAHINVITEAEQ